MPKEKPTAVWGAIVANLLVALAKFVAAFISGSSAMLAEGIHSTVDTGNELLLLVGIARSKRAPDAMHPFGYGKELYYWSLIVAILLFGIGGGMSVFEGIRAAIHPEPNAHPFWNYIILGVSVVAEASSWRIATKALGGGDSGISLWRRVRRSKDPTKFLIVGEDTAALAGLAAAALGIMASQLLESPLPDAIASIAIGLILCATAGYLVLETKGLLIGEGADPALVAQVEDLVSHKSFTDHFSRPLTMHLGPHQILVNLDLTVRTNSSAAELVESIDKLEGTLRAKFPDITRIYISPRLHD